MCVISVCHITIIISKIGDCIFISLDNHMVLPLSVGPRICMLLGTWKRGSQGLLRPPPLSSLASIQGNDGVVLVLSVDLLFMINYSPLMMEPIFWGLDVHLSMSTSTALKKDGLRQVAIAGSACALSRSSLLALCSRFHKHSLTANDTQPGHALQIVHLVLHPLASFLHKLQHSWTLISSGHPSSMPVPVTTIELIGNVGNGTLMVTAMLKVP